MQRAERAKLWKPFQQTLSDFAMNNDVCVLVFLGTPEGATRELQDEIGLKDPQMMVTETVNAAMRTFDEAVRSEPKLMYRPLSKEQMWKKLRNRVTLRLHTVGRPM